MWLLGLHYKSVFLFEIRFCFLKKTIHQCSGVLFYFEISAPNADYRRPMKTRTFGRGQTNWANKFLDIWGILAKMLSALIISKTLYPHPNQIFIGDWVLNLGHKELEL